MKDKRTKLIRQASTQDADGPKWRNRQAKWMAINDKKVVGLSNCYRAFFSAILS